jgi:hypothetical protein
MTLIRDIAFLALQLLNVALLCGAAYAFTLFMFSL